MGLRFGISVMVFRVLSATKTSCADFKNLILIRLLRAGTTGGAPLPPLKVECKPLWQPVNVARAYVPDPFLENFGSDAAPERLLLGRRAALFHLETSTRILSCERVSL